MTILNLYTLQTVYTLNFRNHVILYCLGALDLQKIVRVDGTLGENITGLKYLTIQHLQSGTVWNQIGLGLTSLGIRDDNLSLLRGFLDLNDSRNLGKDRKSLRSTSLEKLLDSRKTLGDIATRYTTGMEGSHRKLSTRLTDGLCSDDTNSLTDLYRLTGCQVRAVALRTDTILRTAGEDGSDLHLHLLLRITLALCHILIELLLECSDDLRRTLRCYHAVCLHNELSGLRIIHILCDVTTGDTLLQGLDLLLAFLQCGDLQVRDLALICRAVKLTDDQILGNVNHSSCKVTGVSRTKRGIGKSLSSTVCGDEVLEYVKTLTEVRLDRELDGTSGCICHESSHTSELLDLLIGSTGSGIRHHEDVIVCIESTEKILGQLIIGLLPGIDNFLITLLLGNETTTVVPRDLVNDGLCVCQQLLLARRDGHIRDGYGHRRDGGLLIAHRLDIIQGEGRLGSAMYIHDSLQNLLEILLLYDEVNLRKNLVARNRTIHETEILRDDLIENQTADGGIYNTLDDLLCAILRLYNLADSALDQGVHRDVAILLCENRLIDALEEHALVRLTRTCLRNIVDTEYHIL